MRYTLERLLIAVLSLWTGLATLHAANTVTVEGIEGSPRQQVAIKVSLSTEAADVAAAEIRVPLPEEVVPVEGSLALNGTRAPEHSVTADMNGREYVIVLFNTSLKTILAGEGELLTFKVNLGDNPGHYDLTPKIKLSDAKGAALSVNASGGTLSVLAPRMELGTLAVDFGRVPIQSEAVRDVAIRNIGTTALTVSDYTTGVEGLTAVLPGKLEAGDSGYIELHYRPTVRSNGIDDRITPISNSVGRSQFVRIQSVPFSVNELHIGNAVGICDEEVTVSVAMNNMEQIAGADFTIPLSEELDFVEGSVEKGERASGLSVESYLNKDRRLRIVLFGTDNKAVDGNEGELLTFRLKLKGRSGGYSVSPEKVILANSSGENMVSAVYAGDVRISSPRLSAPSEWGIGNVPLSGTDTFLFSLRSEGEAPLTIEKIVFLNDIAESTDQFPIVIAPYEERNISVKFRQPEFGPFATTMNIYTNDPDNRMKRVNVTGNFYSPNEMSVSGRYDNGKFFIDASLSNEEAIAALQLDVLCPDGVSTDESLVTLSSRAQNHTATLAKVDDNRYRLVIFSLKNTPFIGNEGILFSLGLDGESLIGKQVRIENIKLSSADGVNMTTPNSEVKVGDLPVPVTGITLSQESVVLKVGEMVSLTAIVQPENATDKTKTWISSNEAVVVVDSNGNVTSKSLGEATVTATCGTVSAACTFTVIPTPVESVTISTTTLALTEGETATLTATVAPADATDKTVTWTSSDASIASVSADGVVAAVKVGTATVTAASSNGKTASCMVTVLPVQAESVTLDRSEWSGKVGAEVKLTVTVAPANTTDKTVTWTSSKEAVAMVDGNGNVKAVGLGESVITATCGAVSAICKVTVVPTPVESVTLSNNALNLTEGETAALTATVAPAHATDKTVTWTSSDVAFASVSAEGVVTAVKAGKATITATSTNGKTASCEVTVVANIIAVTGITISKTELSLIEGESETLTASILPENATDKTVTWTSSDASVATVKANGKVTAVKVGTASITAASSNGKTATCMVTVLPVQAESVTLDRAEWSGKVGAVLKLTATVTPANTTDKTVTWTSSNESVATVDGNGYVKAVGLGETVITATCGAVSASCLVTVVPTLVETLTIDPTAWSGEEGSEFSIAATVLPEDATDKTLVWTSSDEAVATVDGEGNVKVLKEGTCTITVATADGSNLISECVITSISGVEAIFGDDTSVDVYDMNGMLLKKGCERGELKELLTPGVYILKRGSKTVKVVVKD